MPDRFAGLIATVGGTGEPVLKTLNDNYPQYVLFIVSEGSISTVEKEVLPGMGYAPAWDYLVISDPNNMGTIYQELRDGRVEQWLKDNELDVADVYLDITGGTKAMTAALALAGVENFHFFSYVGGTERNKENLGTVVSGSEYLVSTPNPWDTYAVRDLELASKMLAGCNADSASSILDAASHKCSPDLSRQLTRFASMARMLGSIDRFNFRDVPQYVNGQNFRELTTRFPGLVDLGNHWKAVSDDLAREDQTPGRPTLLELLANAQRRASQHRYDDAVGRIYRAVELYAQQLVKQAFGVELGRVTRESIPPRSRDSFDAQFGRSFRDRSYNLGLANMYQCLDFSENPRLRAKTAVHASLRDRLENRHKSLLAHGVRPVDHQIYQTLMGAALAQLEITQDEIPRWPDFELSVQ